MSDLTDRLDNGPPETCVRGYDQYDWLMSRIRELSRAHDETRRRVDVVEAELAKRGWMPREYYAAKEAGGKIQPAVPALVDRMADSLQDVMTTLRKWNVNGSNDSDLHKIGRLLAEYDRIRTAPTATEICVSCKTGVHGACDARDGRTCACNCIYASIPVSTAADSGEPERDWATYKTDAIIAISDYAKKRGFSEGQTEIGIRFVPAIENLLAKYDSRSIPPPAVVPIEGT